MIAHITIGCNSELCEKQTEVEIHYGHRGIGDDPGSVGYIEPDECVCGSEIDVVEAFDLAYQIEKDIADLEPTRD